MSPKNYIWNRRVRLIWEGENNRKINPLMENMVHRGSPEEILSVSEWVWVMVHRSNIHYSKKGNWKRHIKFPVDLQKWDLPGTQFSSPLGRWATYFRHRCSIKPFHETFEKPIMLNPHSNLNFSSNKPYFYSISTKNNTEKFTTIRDLIQFLQPSLNSCTRFEEELRHSS